MCPVAMKTGWGSSIRFAVVREDNDSARLCRGLQYGRSLSVRGWQPKAVVVRLGMQSLIKVRIEPKVADSHVVSSHQANRRFPFGRSQLGESYLPSKLKRREFFYVWGMLFDDIEHVG